MFDMTGKNEVIKQGLYGAFIISDSYNWEKTIIEKYGFSTVKDAKDFILKNSNDDSRILIYTYVMRLDALCLIPIEGGTRSEL